MESNMAAAVSAFAQVDTRTQTSGERALAWQRLSASEQASGTGSWAKWWVGAGKPVLAVERGSKSALTRGAERKREPAHTHWVIDFVIDFPTPLHFHSKNDSKSLKSAWEKWKINGYNSGFEWVSQRATLWETFRVQWSLPAGEEFIQNMENNIWYQCKVKRIAIAFFSRLIG